MKLVTLEKLNSMRFPDDPRPMHMLQRWCRQRTLPARKIGGEWYVDLEEFDRPHTAKEAAPIIDRDTLARAILNDIRAERGN